MEKKVFEKCVLGGIEVKNRFVRSATHESMAENGFVSEDIIKMYEDLSAGQVGAIITGYISFASSDNLSPSTMQIGDDSFFPGLEKLNKTAHEHGTKVVAQLNHSGSQLFSAPQKRVLAPSNVSDPVNNITPEPFSVEEIKTFIKEFGKAASRAKKAGFDGVQIHGAHSYLLSKFLSPEFNIRDDEYGGSISNNTRIIIEILKEIKSRCGKDFPVWIKLNASNFNGNGFNENNFYEVCEILSAEGIDAIEVSSGIPSGKYGPSRSSKHKAYNLEYCEKISEKIDADLILVGGLRELETIEKIIADTKIKGVSISRPLIREPGLVKRWMAGDKAPALCIACNGCFNPKGTKCFFSLSDEEKKVQKKIMKMIAMAGSKKE